MKKILLSVVAVMLGVSFCFAQQPPAAPKAPQAAPTKPAMPAMKIVMGKVKSVTLADAAKGVKPEIVVIDEAGKDMALMVMPATVITDKEGKVVTLDKVANGSSVRVKYNGDTKEAVKIRMQQ